MQTVYGEKTERETLQSLKGNAYKDHSPLRLRNLSINAELLKIRNRSTTPLSDATS